MAGDGSAEGCQGFKDWLERGHGGERNMKAAVKRLWKDVYDYKIGILAFLLYDITVHMAFHAFCPLVLFAGLPCAGCGMTRAMFFLITGQFARSWALHPMAFPVLLFLLYCVMARYLMGKRVWGFKAGVILLCFGMLAVYGYRMCAVFPKRPPYVYTGGNFLERHVPFYREFLRKKWGI